MFLVGLIMQDSKHRSLNKNEEASTPSSAPLGSKHLFISAFAALVAGLAASLAAVVLMVVLRLAAGVPTPVELFGDRVLRLLPAARFVDFLIKFGSHSKTAPLGRALLGMIGLGALLGLVYAALVRLKIPVRGYRPTLREWLMAVLLTLGMTPIRTLAFWGDTGHNFVGLPQDGAFLGTMLCRAP